MKTAMTASEKKGMVMTARGKKGTAANMKAAMMARVPRLQASPESSRSEK
jgi:hypothetical protein